MPTQLPFVFRVTAGLIADTVDRLRQLPADLPALSISLAGAAAKASIKINQHLAELATKGDQLLTNLPFGADQTEPERTAWSRIDDEDESADLPETTEPAGEHRADAGLAAAPSAVTEPTDQPDALPDYSSLTLVKLRHALPDLTVDQIQDLLEYEQRHKNRAGFLTLLTNRITTLRADAG